MHRHLTVRCKECYAATGVHWPTVSTAQDDAVCTNCGLIIAHGIVADEAAAGEAGEGCCEMKLVSDSSSGWELSTADSDHGLLSCSNADVVDEESNVANVANAR